MNRREAVFCLFWGFSRQFASREVFNLCSTELSIFAWQLVHNDSGPGSVPHNCLMKQSSLLMLRAFERRLILTRTAEGRENAKQKGIKFGRPAVVSKELKAQIAALRAEGTWTARQIGERLGCRGGLSIALWHRDATQTLTRGYRRSRA